MKKITFLVFIICSLAFSASILPTYSRAETEAAPKLDYSGFVKCDGVVTAGEEARDTRCDFAALMDTITKLINWVFVISIPIAALLFAYAGLLYMTGTSGNRTKANNVFTSVAKGFIIMLVAWMAVYSVIKWIVKPGFGATSLIEQKK